MLRCFRPPVHVPGVPAVGQLFSNWWHDWFSLRVFTSCTRKTKTCSTGTEQRQCVRGPCPVHSIQIPTPSTTTVVGAHDGSQLLDPVSELLNHLSLQDRTNTLASMEKLKYLYTAVKRHRMLHRVSSKQMTKIIGIFGTLSIPSPRPVCIYISKHVPQLDDVNNGAHWNFILEVARDKERLLYPLNGTDRFWIMRAELARLPTLPDQVINRSILRAKMQYVRIWRHTPDPEVHVPFLEALLLHSTSDLSDAVKYICRLLGLYSNLHHRILDVLWTIVLGHGTSLSLDQRASLLSVCSKHFGLSPGTKGAVGAGCEKTDETLNFGAKLTGRAFPRFVVRRLRSNLQQWVQDISVASFHLSIHLETRWSNLVLLAAHFKPHGAHKIDDLPSTILTDEIIEWRTTVILSILERESSRPISPSVSRKFANTLHSIWCGWISSKSDRPLLVSHVVLASFMRLAGIAGDVKLFDDCANYATLRGLWSTPRCDSASATMHMLAAYVSGSLEFRGASMPHIFQILNEKVSTDMQRAHVIRDLVQHFTVHDVKVAHKLYQCCQKRHVFVPTVDVHRMAMNLATSHHIREAVNFLHTTAFSPGQVEVLLGAVLRAFQTMRLETMEPRLVAEICIVIEALYERRNPLTQLKYPLRYFLSIIISSDHPSMAVSIVKTLTQRSPYFFTVRLYTRLINALFCVRQFKHVVRMFRISKKTMPCHAIDIIRGKMIFCLAKAGATKLSQVLYREHNLSTTHLSMLRAASFRIRNPTIFGTFRAIRMFFRKQANEQEVKNVVNLLIRARRLYAARKIVQLKCSDLQPESVTVIGNTILTGLFLYRGLRNRQLVARILYTKILLENTCQFSPDRLTINIIMKAIMQWRTVIDSFQLKILFDCVIRLGYPSGNQNYPQYGVPFGTPPTNVHILDLPILSSPLSFRKHVEPLYKMFIKAFSLRNDAAAAKTIIGILKDETFKARQKQKIRERARWEGLQKKARIGPHI